MDIPGKVGRCIQSVGNRYGSKEEAQKCYDQIQQPDHLCCLPVVVFGILGGDFYGVIENSGEPTEKINTYSY